MRTRTGHRQQRGAEDLELHATPPKLVLPPSQRHRLVVRVERIEAQRRTDPTPPLIEQTSRARLEICEISSTSPSSLFPSQRNSTSLAHRRESCTEHPRSPCKVRLSKQHNAEHQSHGPSEHHTRARPHPKRQSFECEGSKFRQTKLARESTTEQCRMQRSSHMQRSGELNHTGDPAQP